jgi:molybdopterin-biosynthesis enzyme MoeA-like protein
MAIGLIIIGDEILSGRRVDQHFPVLQMLPRAACS